MRVAFAQSSSVTTVGSTSTTLFVSLSLHLGQMRNGFEIFHCLPQTAFTSFSFRLIPSPRRRLLLSTCPLPAPSPTLLHFVGLVEVTNELDRERANSLMARVRSSAQPMNGDFLTQPASRTVFFM